MSDAPSAAGAMRVGIAVIVREGLVLIDRRADGPLAGWWEFPGGKVRSGETTEDCVRRECREEIGVEVEPVELLRTALHEYPHGKVQLHFHLCRITAGEPRPLAPAEIAWVTPAGTAAYRFLPPNAPVVEELVRRFGSRSEAPSPQSGE